MALKDLFIDTASNFLKRRKVLTQNTRGQKIFFCSILTNKSYFCDLFPLWSSRELNQHRIVREKLRTNFKHYIQLVFRKTKWNEEHSIWDTFPHTPSHYLSPCYDHLLLCKNHYKIYWLKITTILLSLMILGVDWVQLGSSFAAGDLVSGLQSSGALTGLQCPSLLMCASHASIGMDQRLKASVNVFSELGWSGSWAFLSFSLYLVSGSLLLSVWLQQNFHEDSELKHDSRSCQAFFRVRCRTSTI